MSLKSHARPPLTSKAYGSVATGQERTPSLRSSSLTSVVSTQMSISVDKLHEAYARLDRHLKERDYEAVIKASKSSTWLLLTPLLVLYSSQPPPLCLF